jgi:hypothetical protein
LYCVSSKLKVGFGFNHGVFKLGMQYATKLKAYPSNPAYDCVFNPLWENVYDKQPYTIQPFGVK